ncbi:DUF885 family protein [Alteriqipengyuania sp.]|uniref:DUF885 domain-containing protein n=1 Tax=Alteriqipengyuania sp. TaxID=2800692 RepID=UPI0035161175
MKRVPIAATMTASLALAACAGTPGEMASVTSPAPAVSETSTAPQQVPADIDDFFDAYDDAQLASSPLTKAYRGIRDEDYGEWGDFTLAGVREDQQRQQNYAARMRASYDVDALGEQDALSYRLFDAMAQRSASLAPFTEYNYLFDQMNGAQSGLPAFLINIHAVQNAAHAEAYISRIAALGGVIDTLTARARAQAEAGVMPPDWVYSYVISDIRNLLDAGTDNAVLEDFNGKVMRLRENAQVPISESRAIDLTGRAAAAWTQSAVPAYRRLLAEMERQQAIAPTEDGIWRFDKGAQYYDALLASYTTTDLTADQIHRLGVENVARIHDEMRTIMRQVGFEGTLQEFFEFTRTDDRFYYDTREAYLADAQAVIDAMEAKLPEYFTTLPKADMVIKPVEAFREQSAGKAFYQSPAPDGSRPGTYYVNLYNLKDMSKNELEALAYHEAVPGHHLQRAIQTELGDVPPFRRFGGVTAYTEGWGLYSEDLPKEMGFYTDPYSDFGRLQMELWRACRLVVDTGIHSKRWSRERAIQYLKDNTPNPDGDIRKAIERYIVMPGQATAYMIGKLKIMELREKARAELGEDFDIRAFHDVVLLDGPVPLSILEENVEAWIAQEKGG